MVVASHLYCWYNKMHFMVNSPPFHEEILPFYFVCHLSNYVTYHHVI